MKLVSNLVSMYLLWIEKEIYVKELKKPKEMKMGLTLGLRQREVRGATLLFKSLYSHLLPAGEWRRIHNHHKAQFTECKKLSRMCMYIDLSFTFWLSVLFLVFFWMFTSNYSFTNLRGQRDGFRQAHHPNPMFYFDPQVAA